MRHLLVPLAVVALAVGCTPDVAPTASPSVFVSPTASASPSVSPSPSPTAVESFPPAPATESVEQAAIRAAWMEYWSVFGRFAGDPALTDLTETQRITTGDAQNSIIETIRSLREANIRFLGGLAFREIDIQEPSPRPDGLRESVVRYCLDRSSVRNVDATTGTAVENTGPLTWIETVSMVEGLDSKWRVARISGGEDPC